MNDPALIMQVLQALRHLLDDQLGYALPYSYWPVLRGMQPQEAVEVSTIAVLEH